MKFFETFSSFVLNTTLFALVGVGVLVVGSILPIFGSHRVFVVQSGSMEPALGTGSVIFITPEVSYRVGDIVTWQPSGGGTPITHRIVTEFSDGGERYQTKGDANESKDSVIDRSQVLGRVAFQVPYLGYPVSFAKRPIGFFLLILLPSLLIIFDEILNLRRALMRRTYEKSRKKIESLSSKSGEIDAPFPPQSTVRPPAPDRVRRMV